MIRSILLVLIFVQVIPAAVGNPVPWSDEFATALTSAKQQGKQVLVLIANTTLTRGSRLLLNKVFTDPHVTQWVDQHTVPVLIDFGTLSPSDAWHQQQYQRVLQELEVSEVPTIVMLNKRGKEHIRLENFIGGPLQLITTFAETLGQEDVLRALGPVADAYHQNNAQRNLP
jgi:thioredoxin-related protein